MQTEIKIGIVGLWHLGCVLSAAWSKLGYKVVGFDYSKDLIDNLNRNKPPIYEPDLEKIFVSSKDKGRLSFTNDIELLNDCDFIFLTYDTPVLDNDESDLTLLQTALDKLGGVLKNEGVVIVSSQTPVGTCQRFRAKLKVKNSTVELVYSPENLRLGEAIQCYLNPGRVIIGAESESALAKTVSLFKSIDAEIISMRISSAEMVKHGINSFLATSITFANHMADLCEMTGANISDVVRGMKTDPRIGVKAYLTPGIGFSGGTLGRDLRVLEGINNRSNKHAGIFEDVYRFNLNRKYTILGKIRELVNSSVELQRVGALGVTYKPGTSTLRRSLPMEIVDLMVSEGMEVAVFDPKANYDEYVGKKNFLIELSASDLIKKSSMIVLFTEWPDFKELPWGKCLNEENPQTVFDTKNYLTDLELSKIGYRYVGIGYKS